MLSCRILCPWTAFPVSFKLKMNLADIKNPTNGSHLGQRHIILLAVIVTFIVVLFITMDIHKNRAKYKASREHQTKEAWIHDSNSLFHYGIVLDCGSTGTSVFIYYWPDHNGNKEHLLNIQQMIDRDGKPVRLKVRPGTVFIITVEPEYYDHTF